MRSKIIGTDAYWRALVCESPEIPTPYILTDPMIARKKVELFNKLMPRIKVYYAVKSHSDVRLMHAIDDLVDGYDIASLGELRLLKGTRPERILYSNPVKIPEHIAQAHAKGVAGFAFDSMDEIDKLAEYAPNAHVYLRIKVADHGSRFPLSGKFGIDAAFAQNYAKAAEEKGLHVKGITFHVGSQAENTHVWAAAIKTAGDLARELKQSGINVEFIDIGGGFPADYGIMSPSIQEVSDVINSSLEKYVDPSILIYAEPGRYISANASVIATTIIGREYRGGADWIYLDMGAFQGLIEPLEMPGWKYPIITHKKPRARHNEFVLTGPTCDPYDTLGVAYDLPADLKRGDRIIIAAAGAYTTVYSSQFNGFDPPKAYYVQNGVIE